MKNKQRFYIFCILMLILCLFSCNRNSDFYDDERLDNIIEVNIYVEDKIWSIEGDVKNKDDSLYYRLMPEDEIRGSGMDINIQTYHPQAKKIAKLIYSAKKTSSKHNNVKIKYYKGEPLYFKTGGMVIDIIKKINKEDGGFTTITETYIMQNGAEIFYKKGEEGVYYKMPKQLLKGYLK